jgi:hypothetical protein
LLSFPVPAVSELDISLATRTKPSSFFNLCTCRINSPEASPKPAPAPAETLTWFVSDELVRSFIIKSYFN